MLWKIEHIPQIEREEEEGTSIGEHWLTLICLFRCHTIYSEACPQRTCSGPIPMAHSSLGSSFPLAPAAFLGHILTFHWLRFAGSAHPKYITKRISTK
ncbi:hypothetical protein M5D96_010540 [Drosophila gunungcola]|uniref:Uncharacterized protein n=1 Tax=Drosophila gunungcola TaxID=103775 RepID=A0A9Q0BMC7_9MUSC|nr:hypothetical protein M5D96_010540 [Drosophila gunungcola]